MILGEGHNWRAELYREEAALGVIVSDSQCERVQLRLDEAYGVEEVRAGKFVVVRAERMRFFGIINVVKLDSAHPGVHVIPLRNRLMADAMRGTATLGIVARGPTLMLPNAAADCQESLLPVKTVPAHFSMVTEDTRDDVSRVFARYLAGEQSRRARGPERGC